MRPDAVTATMRSVAVPSAAPRPPMTYATGPSAAAAACVVGAGSRPIRTTRPEPGTYSSTAAEAAPLGSEPPAITSRPPAAVTAAYRSGVGRCATTRAGDPGRQATIVSSQLVPV